MPLKSEILKDAPRKIARFNSMGLHYNLVADQIYAKRFARGTDPFDESFLPYIIAGLLSFDMGRMMGVQPHECFAKCLRSKLQHLRQPLKPLMTLGLTQTNLQEHHDVIINSYSTLSSAEGEDALNRRCVKHKREAFCVGTTKILHFLNPELFIIVDSNAVKAFRLAHNVPLGYSANSYMRRMNCAWRDISTYGLKRFQELEPGVPITRIYDKLTFVTGYALKKGSA